MERRCGPAVLPLWAIAMLLLLPITAGRYLKFEPGFEYQYKYHSIGQVHRVDKFTMEARVSYSCIRVLPEGQEIKLRVIALTLTSGKVQGVAGHSWDLSKWFSFVLTPRGEVLHVTHEAGEDEETLAIKKGLAALLAARLHHHTEEDDVKIIRTRTGWRYDVKELGHEGPHNATYHVSSGEKGDVFTKIRHNHPVAHATGNYTKKMHYHNDLKILHKVVIEEHFDAMANPPQGYDPSINGHPKPEEEDKQPVLPSMTGEGKGTLEFLTKVHVQDKTSLVPPHVPMAMTSIHVDKVRKNPGPPLNLTDVQGFITGNLTCMRNQPESGGSKQLQDCFHSLLDVLRRLRDSDITVIVSDYFGQDAGIRHYQKDRQHILDVVWTIYSDHAQNEITKAVLLSDVPQKAYVERLLYLIGGMDDLPSQFVMDTVITMTFEPESQKPLFQKGDFRHRLLLVVGTLIRRLNAHGDTERAAVLATRLQDMLGLHDPYEFRRKRSSLSEEQRINQDLWKVALLESLGNGRLDQSYEHIVSHVNNTNSEWVKRAGVHALRDYHHEHAADVIMMVALYDEHETVRYEAVKEYRRHPFAHTMYDPDQAFSNSSSYLAPHPDGVDMTAVSTHHRRRRDLFEDFELLLETPSVDWQKILGSKKIGASFGLTIKNMLDIKIGLLDGHGKIDIHDEAFGQVNLGFMGFNIDILRIRLCFKGSAAYNLNLFQEFDPKTIERTVKMWDKMKTETVTAITDGINFFRDILEGNISFGDLLKAFGDVIKNLPQKISEVMKKVYVTLNKISQYEDKELPPFMIPLKNLVLKVATLVHDVQNDVWGFYNRLMTASILIPYSGKQVFESVEDIIDGFENFQRDPKGAVSAVTSGTLVIGVQVTAMAWAVNDVKEAAFFLKKEKPYWWDLRGQSRILMNMSKEVHRAIVEDGPKWVDSYSKSVTDKIDRFTRGNITMAQLREKAVADLKALPEIANTLLPLENLGDDMQETFMDLFSLVVRIRKAYVNLKKGVRFAQQVIDRIFGPKAHKKFPTTARLPGNGCEGKGFYPSALNATAPNTPEYRYEGTDLMSAEGVDVVAPFPGIVYLSGRRDEVVIESRGGSPKGVDFIITNVRANSTIKLLNDPYYNQNEVVAGQIIGQTTRSPCRGSNHIHFAIRKGNGTVDPTRYVEPRFPDFPFWNQVCDDYKYVYKGRTLASGTIAGLAGRKKNDTSPARSADPPAQTKVDKSKSPAAKVDEDVNKPGSTASKVKENKEVANKAANSSQDSSMKTLFNSAMTYVKKFNVKDMKMGSMVRLLYSMQFDESLRNLTSMFKTIQAIVNNKPCVNPNTMPDEDIRGELKKRGILSNGTRTQIIKKLKKRPESCPVMALGMPDDYYCNMDSMCLGLECCLNIKVAFYKKVYKLWARFDPCEFSLNVGISEPLHSFNITFGPEYGLDDIIGGFDETVMTNIQFEALGAVLYLKVKMEKEDTSGEMTVELRFCKSDDPEECVAKVKILDRVIIPLPLCGPDGTVHTPGMDLKKLLKNQKAKFKTSGKTTLSTSVSQMAAKAFSSIPCLASEDTSDNLPCDRPDSMTEETLTQALLSRGLSTSGTAQERIDRLEFADSTCTLPGVGNTLTLPSINDTRLANMVYLKLSSDCLRVEACVDIPFDIPTAEGTGIENQPAVNFTRSVRAAMRLDVCAPTFQVNFESCLHEVLLFNTTMDFNRNYLLSDSFTLKTSIVKADTDTSYTVGLGMRIQMDTNAPAHVDGMFISGFQIPIPPCADFVLPGNGSLRAVASSMGNKLTAASVKFYLKALKLDTVLIEGSCTSVTMAPTSCPVPIDYQSYLPAEVQNNVTCVMTSDCRGITCCLDVDIDLPMMIQTLEYHLPFHMTFDPCDNMKVDMAFGGYTRTEELLNYEFGQTKVVSIGKGQYDGDAAPMDVTYAVNHFRTMDPYDEGFLLDLRVRLCVPFDGQQFCVPDDLGIDVMVGQKVRICSPASKATISSFNLTTFLEESMMPVNTRVLPESVAQMLLNEFGMTSNMKATRCDQQRGLYAAAVDGWRNECPEPLQRLPSLPENAVCHLSRTCNRVDCCIYSEFLDMTFDAWFDLNCDQYLQGGVERLVSPKHNVLGGEVDWNHGVSGTVNVSEAFRINYRVHKDSMNYVVDATIQVCFDQTGAPCQQEVQIMQGTKIPQLGCNPSNVTYYNELFKWSTCTLPTAATGCHISLPASLGGKCVQTNGCDGIHCCLPVDMGFLGEYSVEATFDFDRCANSFVYTIEKKTGTLGLSAIVDVPQTEQIGNAIKFDYQVKSTASGYSLDADLELCVLDPDTQAVSTCHVYDLLPDDVPVYAPSSQCSGRRKKRATAKKHKYNCENSPLTKNQLMLYMIESENATVADLEACVAVFKKKDASKCDRLGNTRSSPAKVNTPRGMFAGLGSKNPSTLHTCNKAGIISFNFEGENVIHDMLTKGANIRGRLAQTYVPGVGLTNEGLKALSFKISNMTIGELQAFVLAEGIDPDLALEFMRNTRDLVFALYSDVMRKITDGGQTDLFKSFDLTINGDFSVPRSTTNFFEYKQFFLVGGLVPMTFEFEAGITTGTQVLVAAKVMNMQIVGQIVPFVGLRVLGSLSIGALLYGKLQLTGYICQIALPSTATITFSQFPMDIELAMDLELIPLELKLAALVTLEVDLGFTKIKKTLFKTSIFEYKTPTIVKRVLEVGKKEPDTSPPQFDSYEQDTASRRRRSLGTDKCLVRQTPGLDYTEPAIEISVTASDDKSQPQLMVYAGTSPGLQNLLAKEMGGPSTIITDRLSSHGIPVYFTVKATNDGGGSSEVTCSIDTYDITLPTGRLEAEFSTTSNRHVLHGSLVVHEDSVLTSTDLSVGLGKGAYAGGVRSWEPVDLMDRSAEAYNPASDPEGNLALANHFTDFKEGRLVVPKRLVAQVTTGINFQECAKKCMVVASKKCKSFNYHSDSTCELLDTVAGTDHVISVAMNYLHFERLGVGLAHEFKLDIPMVHNSLYYINFFMENTLQFTNFISSEGTLVDLTTPHPGPINITSDRYEIIPCSDNIPADRRSAWIKWCRGQDMTLPNHRIIEDGENSETLFNGHEKLTDLLYTKANTYVSANWDGIHDYESGILGYTLTVGREMCEEWLHPHHDPHSHLVPIDDDDQWTHIGVVNTPNDIRLPDGKYWVTLRALNEVQYGGPLSTTICHRTPYAIDTSPPIVYEVYGTKYDEETYIIKTKYNASDPHSDILELAICLGRSIINCNILPWAVANATDFYEGPASLVYQIEDGVLVWIRLRAENGVELQAVGHAKYPIIVDMSPPLAGTVYDGSISKHDLAFSKDQYQYCANWFNFTDPQSGIAFYMGAVLDEYGVQLTNLTQLDRRSHVNCMPFDDPPLQHNHTYRFLLYAFNAGHKQLNVSAESDGVLVDLTPPVTGDVIDGLRPNFTDISYSVHKATVAAQWRGFDDPESDVIQYEIQVERAANLTQNFAVIQAWESENLATTYENHHYHLNHRDVVKTTVRATNGALNTASQESNYFIVDMTPPDLISLWDGVGSADVDFQTSTTQLDASFEFIDEESGVDHYKYQVYRTMHGQRVQIQPATTNTWVDLAPGARTGITVSGMTLSPGLKYSIRLAAVNHAGAAATYDTNGVIIDPTPPVMDYVYVGVLSSEDEILIDGHVLQNDRSGIKATWLATDHESGVTSYQVAVGTSAGATDVLNWRQMGGEKDGYIGGLNLQLTDAATNAPLYYVSVRATNGAGDVCSAITSNSIKILQEDEAGIVTDGGEATVVMSTMATSDADFQLDKWSVTAQFSGYTSHLHGMSRFDWAVGTTPGGEDVMPFSVLGIVHDEAESATPGDGIASRGVAQTVLPLQPDRKYYTTVRAFNNDGQAVQSVSDGFTVDNSPPDLNLISLAKENNDSALTSEAVLYQREPDVLSAEWNFADSRSDVVAVRYAVGTYPGADDVIPVAGSPVNTGDASLPTTAVYLNTQGKPNIVVLWAENSVGLETQIVSPSVLVDNTAPEVGVVICPLYVQAHSQALCKWSGFSDPESSIMTFTFFLGTAPGLRDVMEPVTLPGYVTSYPTVLSNLTQSIKVYASLVATNAMGLNATATSEPIATDTTPPVAGTVVELSDKYVIVAGDDSATVVANTYSCESVEDCQAIDVLCQESLTSVLVAWSPFDDPETSIAKYEVAVGTTPGGGQLRKLEPVAAGNRFHRVQGLNLMGEKKIYVTVKATNGAGASTTATSNGVHMSYLSQGLSPPGPVVVMDSDSVEGDLDYQTSLTTMSARWTVEGDACPAVSYQWAIERVDGHRVFDFYDTNGATSGLNDGVTLSDLETYYQLVRVTNALGYTYTLRSDGITVHQDLLIPGEVFDGSKAGFDLKYQGDVTKVSANWQGFGDKVVITDVEDDNVQKAAAELLSDEKTSNQQVIRYQIALGTDRRYDFTRDNVVPWTDVGLNTSVTFYDLDLTPLTATYYFSVRAYSGSNSRAEVTSNGFACGFDSGVTGGHIDIEDYISTNDSMELSWTDFYSDVGMFIYYVAVSSSPVDNTTCQEYTDGGALSEADRRLQFDVADRVNTRMQTYALLQNLTMTQDTDVYVHIIGVDRAGLCRMVTKTVHIDITPPNAGGVKSGPYYNMSLSFAPSSTVLTVDWEIFQDLESPIKSYLVELLMQPACDVNVSAGGDVISSFTIGSNYTSYTFRLLDSGLSLTTAVPYYVRVTATNKADLSTNVTAGPVIYDDSDPVAGLVVDGADFALDEAWVGSNSTFTGSILHLATPLGPACPPRPLFFSNSTWTYASSDWSEDHTGRKLTLVTQPEKATILDDSSVKITLTRDTNMGRMYTATILKNADIVQGGTYEMDIQAAGGDGNAVTSVMLWCGDSDDVVYFDYTHVTQEEFCMCCMEASPTADCNSVCSGCSDYIEFYLNNTASANASAATTGRRKRSAGVQRLTEAEKQELLNGTTLEDLNAAAAPKIVPSCGVNLYALNSTDPEYADGYLGRMVVWCMFGEDTYYEPEYLARPLTFDPSAQSHHYKIKVYKTNDESASPTYCIGVSLDGDTLEFLEVCGIPSLNSTTKLALSVWNWKDFLEDTSVNDTGIALWQASATFSNLVFPANSAYPCRYGNPFRGGQNPIVGYEAGIGSASGLDDVVSFTEVYKPCFPCVHACDDYGCDPACDGSATLPLTFSLSGLDLPVVANTSSEEFAPLLYYFTVKALLGSGRSTVVSSDGFSIDTSPPVPDPSVFFYLDVAQGEAKPVTALMASNSTIQVTYACWDNESSVVDYEWAIGTTPGGQDIQSYVSTGKNPTGRNDELLGVIAHNTAYYVSYKCRNGGGLVTTVEDPKGVIAYLEKLVLSDVGGEMQNTSPIGSNVVPASARQSTDSHSLAMSLTVSQDPTVDLYYMSIGSTSGDKTNDIFPRTAVATNRSGVISISNGNVYNDGMLMFALGAAREGYNGTDSPTAAQSDFSMEPGRELFAFVDSCNEAQCTGPTLMSSVLITKPDSYAAVSSGGESLRVGLTPAARGKRSVDTVSAHSEWHVRVKRATADQVFVETPSGLEAGQTIMLTELTEAELSASYDSVASTSFVSYLTDPTYTLASVDTVDRILVGRATYNSATDVAFSLASVGQLEMPGPVLISFPYDPTDTDNTVQLIHWNPDEQKWQLTSSTCENEADTEVQDSATSTITVKVCDTYGSSTYFMEETLFLLSTVSNTIVNDPPTLTSIATATMLEDEGTLVYEVLTTDPEGDVVTVSLDSPFLSPDEGELFLTTSTNLLLFTPCADCSGDYELLVVLTEVAVAGITPNTATVTVTVTVTDQNDPSTAFAFHTGVDIVPSDPAADIVILLEQNGDNVTVDTSYSWVFGAYDVDNPSNLTLTIELPYLGVLTQSAQMTTVPDCSSSISIQDDTIPCFNMTLPHDASSLAWRYLSLYYRPYNGSHGYDFVRLLATDDGGLGSVVTTVRFAVMEMPCENNGTCVPKSSDYTCDDVRRAEWFDKYYTCNCTEGFEGLHCSGDIDDCAGSPCLHPYICVDLVNSYECQCASDNVDCDGLQGWMIGVIVVGCLSLLLVIAAIVFVWAVRTGRIKWKIFEKILKKTDEDKEPKLKIIDSPEYDDVDNSAFGDVNPWRMSKKGLAVKVPQMVTNVPVPPVLKGISKRSSSVSLDSATSPPSTPSSGYSSTGSSLAFFPNRGSPEVNDPRPDSGLLDALAFQPQQSQQGPAMATSSMTKGLNLRPRHFSVGDAPPLPCPSPDGSMHRSVSQVSVYVDGRKSSTSLQNTPRRSSSTHSLGSVNQSLGRPITPVEHLDKKESEKW